MTKTIMAEIGRQYRNTHENLLDLVESLTDDQIAWTPNETTPSVGFHVWHLARWADYLQEIINGRGSQIWEKEGLAARWNLETKSLGYAQTGMEMDEKTVMLLRMPKKLFFLITPAAPLPPPSRPLARLMTQTFTRFTKLCMAKTGAMAALAPLFQLG